MQALAVSATASRAALLHRQAGRVLSGRQGVDPLIVARHARLGGDIDLASRALREAAILYLRTPSIYDRLCKRS